MQKEVYPMGDKNPNKPEKKKKLAKKASVEPTITSQTISGKKAQK